MRLRVSRRLKRSPASSDATCLPPGMAMGSRKPTSLTIGAAHGEGEVGGRVCQIRNFDMPIRRYCHNVPLRLITLV